MYFAVVQTLARQIRRPSARRAHDHGARQTTVDFADRTSTTVQGGRMAQGCSRFSNLASLAQLQVCSLREMSRLEHKTMGAGKIKQGIPDYRPTTCLCNRAGRASHATRALSVISKLRIVISQEGSKTEAMSGAKQDYWQYDARLISRSYVKIRDVVCNREKITELVSGSFIFASILQVSLALDAARGLQALHEAPGGPIVHYDIKPQQMMLDANGRIKINDLNTCQFADADMDGNSCPFTMSATGVGE